MTKKKKTILFIDDSYLIRQIITEILSSGGYVVRTASDGKQGLNIFDKNPTDIVLTDLMMPPPDGLKVLETIKKNYPQTPVIVLSGKGDLEDVKTALKLGAYDYLTKGETGIDRVSLITAVDRAWERLQLVRENDEYKNELEEKVAERTRELQDTKELLEREQRFSNDMKAEASRKMSQILTKYKTLIDKAPIGIATTNTVATFTGMNNAFVEILGFRSQDQLKDGKISDIESFRVFSFAEKILDCVENKMEETGDQAYCGPDNKNRFIEYTLTPMYVDEFGFEVEVLFTIKDVTLEKEEKTRLEVEATYDGLTNLIKQAKFQGILSEALEDAKENNFQLGVVHIDLDDFGSVNTKYGHPAASEILRSVGQRIKNTIDEGKDYGFRMGGDEFAVVFTKYPTSSLDVIVERLFNKLSGVYSITVDEKEHVIKCTFSLGVSEYSNKDNQNAEKLYKEADKATFDAKDSGKDCFVFYRENS